MPEAYDHRPASEIFEKIAIVQEKITGQLYAETTYSAAVTIVDERGFMEDYAGQYQNNALHEIYKGYYDDKHPVQLDLETLIQHHKTSPSSQTLETLFGNEAVEHIHTALSMQSDLDTLLQLSPKGENKKKSFDYDGVKYTLNDRDVLVQRLELELAGLNERIQQNDADVFNYFYALAKKQGKEEELASKYMAFYKIMADYPAKIEYYVKMANATRFTQENNLVEEIKHHVDRLNIAEQGFKGQVNELLNEAVYQGAVSPEIRQHFTAYLSRDWMYFIRTKYDHDALKVLFTCINDFRFVLSDTFFVLKKELLSFQAELVE